MAGSRILRDSTPNLGGLPTGSPEATRRTPSLTIRGQALVASGGALALGAFLSGAIELYGLAVACLVLVTVGWARLRAATWEVEITRTVVPARFSSGATGRVELSARNVGSRPSPEAIGKDPLGSSGRIARFNIAAIQPGEVRRTTYQLPRLRRGVYKLGPLSVAVSDPFGLAETNHRSAGEATLVVHPRFEVLPYASLHSGSGVSSGNARPAAGAEPDGFLLRRYVAGDDLRRVHWPTTARVGELTLRQDETTDNNLVVVAVDLRKHVTASPPPADDTFEAVLESAATICSGWLRSGSEVRLLTSGGFDSGRGRGLKHLTAILDGLAAAQPHDPGEAPVRLGFRPGDVPLTVVTSDRCTPELLRQLTASQPTHADTVVVVGTATGAPTPPRGVGHSPSRRPHPNVASAEVASLFGEPSELLESLAHACRSIYVPAGSTIGQQLTRGGGPG